MTLIVASLIPAVGDALIPAKCAVILLMNTPKMKQTVKEILSTVVEKKIALEAAVRQKKLLTTITVLHVWTVTKMVLHLVLIIWIIAQTMEHFIDHIHTLLIFARAM